MKKKVGVIYSLSETTVKRDWRATWDEADALIYPQLDAQIDDWAARHGATRVSGITHLRESYPCYTANSRPNQGRMWDWRAWCIVEVPDEPA